MAQVLHEILFSSLSKKHRIIFEGFLRDLSLNGSTVVLQGKSLTHAGHL